MYSSGYSQVLKSSPQAQKKMAYRSKGKSCGYYMRIVFFFSSLIQSLIIVSLVLFLVYGKTQDSASTLRIHDLEESFSRLSIENVALKQQRKNLTNLLNTTLTENGRNKWDLNNLRFLSNVSLFLIQENEAKLKNCSGKLQSCERPGPLMRTFSTFKPPDLCNCGLVTQTLQSKLMLVETNFTQTVQRMRDQLDRTAKERDATTLDAIQLRRDKYKHEKEVEFFRQKCKEDFSQSLSGISEVSRAFLQKIDSLFPSHIAFQLTCPKQREHLEQIRTNCSSLSTEVEDRLQHYLDVVGEKISVIEGENSRLKAENWRLSEDYRSCSNNRTALILQNRQNAEKLQQNHDEVKERLLMDKIGLNGELEVEKKAVKFQSSKIDMLIEQIKKINASCPTKPGYGVPAQPGWALGGSNSGSASPSGGSQLGRSGTGIGGSTGFDFTKALSTGPGGSTGFDLNKPVSTGLGGSTGFDLNKPVSTGSGGSTGFDLNKPVSSGSGGSTGSTFNKPVSPGSSSSIGSTFDKPVSTGSGGSTGSTFNKPVSTGSSGSIGSTFNKPVSPGSSSSIGSTFNKPVSTGSGGSTGSTFNKPVSTGSGSSTGSGLDPQRSSSWSTNKSVPTNSGMSVPAAGNSNSGQSRTGSATGRATSTGNSGGHIISVDQHIRDLQRIINPTGPQDKQDLFKMLG